MMWLAVNLPDLITWAAIAAVIGGAFVAGWHIYTWEMERRAAWHEKIREIREQSAERFRRLAEADKRLSEQMQDFNAPRDGWSNRVDPNPEPVAEPIPAPAAPISNDSGEAIRLNVAEVFSRYDRVLWAEHLIMQLPGQHQDRNAWLMNYGRTPEAHALRVHYNVAFDENTKSARLN